VQPLHPGDLDVAKAEHDALEAEREVAKASKEAEEEERKAMRNSPTSLPP
jgi:hypothetical protein